MPSLVNNESFTNPSGTCNMFNKFFTNLLDHLHGSYGFEKNLPDKKELVASPFCQQPASRYAKLTCPYILLNEETHHRFQLSYINAWRNLSPFQQPSLLMNPFNIQSSPIISNRLWSLQYSRDDIELVLLTTDLHLHYQP